MNGRCSFRIYGKARSEDLWREIEVLVTRRRDPDSPWPFWRNACTTWGSSKIAVGTRFAAELLREQELSPASRSEPVAVAGGRLRDRRRRLEAAAPAWPTASEILAHECGHTWQALRFGLAYLPLVGALTLFREGPHWWNGFENEASEVGLFGGIVPAHGIPDSCLAE